MLACDIRVGRGTAAVTVKRGGLDRGSITDSKKQGLVLCINYMAYTHDYEPEGRMLIDGVASKA